jgi:hypothetical protein
MANGCYGSDWDALEEGLKQCDEVFEAFAATHGLVLHKNHKSPDRYYRWGESPSLLIQVYSSSELPARYTFWVSASDHRSAAQYWKHASLCRDLSASELASSLKSYLDEGLVIAKGWVDAYPG